MFLHSVENSSLSFGSGDFDVNVTKKNLRVCVVKLTRQPTYCMNRLGVKESYGSKGVTGEDRRDAQS